MPRCTRHRYIPNSGVFQEYVACYTQFVCILPQARTRRIMRRDAMYGSIDIHRSRHTTNTLTSNTTNGARKKKNLTLFSLLSFFALLAMRSRRHGEKAVSICSKEDVSLGWKAGQPEKKKFSFNTLPGIPERQSQIVHDKLWQKIKYDALLNPQTPRSSKSERKCHALPGEPLHP